MEAIDIGLHVLEGATLLQTLLKAKENGAQRVFWKRRDVFNMKTLLQILLARKLISSMCVAI